MCISDNFFILFLFLKFGVLETQLLSSPGRLLTVFFRVCEVGVSPSLGRRVAQPEGGAARRVAVQRVSQRRLLLQPGHRPLRVRVHERLVQHLGRLRDGLGHHAAVRVTALAKAPLPQWLLGGKQKRGVLSVESREGDGAERAVFKLIQLRFTAILILKSQGSDADHAAIWQSTQDNNNKK